MNAPEPIRFGRKVGLGASALPQKLWTLLNLNSEGRAG